MEPRSNFRSRAERKTIGDNQRVPTRATAQYTSVNCVPEFLAGERGGGKGQQCHGYDFGREGCVEAVPVHVVSDCLISINSAASVHTGPTGIGVTPRPA